MPGGLQLKTRGGVWIDVATDPTTFIVNIGDLLMRWTNDHWVSNVHRVAIPPSNAGRAKRLPIAFFHHPNYDALIECVALSGQAKYTPVLSGEYRNLKCEEDRSKDSLSVHVPAHSGRMIGPSTKRRASLLAGSTAACWFGKPSRAASRTRQRAMHCL